LIPSIDAKIDAMIDKFDLQKNKILFDIKSSGAYNKLKPEEMKGSKEDVYKQEPYTEDSEKKILLNNIDVNEDSVKEFSRVEDLKIKPEKEKEKTLKEKIKEPFKNVLDVPINITSILPEKFRKSQPIFMKFKNEKIQIDFSIDQKVKPIKLKKLYKQNDSKINETLYKKYWKLTQIYPDVPEIRKRCFVLREVLTEFAKDIEKRRQAENEIKMEKSEQKK